MVTLAGSNLSLCGLSTDGKPTDAEVNQLFLELDTGDVYYWTGEEWAKAGAKAGAGE